MKPSKSFNSFMIHMTLKLIFYHSPKDVNLWSNGKALIATGSPFPPVEIPGSNKKYDIAECNNVRPGLLAA